MNEKEKWQNILLSIIRPLMQHYSSAAARVVLSGSGTTYPQDVIEFESFARPLWGLIPFWMGGGESKEFEEIYLRGFESGSEPDSPEYWGDCSDNDQRFVEMAPIAFAIAALPSLLWEPLPTKAKGNLARWLYQINEHAMPKCNWYFFRIIVNTALRMRGCPYSQELLDSDIAFIESCYEGNGWYHDGVSMRHDYYSAFAMQFYSLLISLITGEDNGEAYRRASEFSYDFIYWFAETGEAIPYGRSLTYRYAMCAFWSALAVSPVKFNDCGIIKGLIFRCMEYWLSKPINHPGSILSIGFGYPNLTMAERYNGPGSPYWALKAFLFLALPDDHPFWEADALPLPRLDGLRKEADAMVISNTGWNAVMYVPGMLGMRSLGHFTEKYDKFAYSSAAPFSVAHTNETIAEAAPDSMLSFLVDGYVYVRRGSSEYSIYENRIISSWSPLPGIEVVTTIHIGCDEHIREHVITSDIECEAYDSGFSVESMHSNISSHSAEAYSEYLHSVVEDMEGEGEPIVVTADPNTNLMWRNTRFPAIKYRIGKGRTVITTKVRLWKN